MNMFQNEQNYNYNAEGFFVCNNYVLYHDRLSDKAKLLYMHITNRYNFFLYANQVNKIGKVTELKEVYCESQATMASALGYSEKSKSKINPLIKQLEEHGLLLVIKKHDGKNSNWYVPLNMEGKPHVTVSAAVENVMMKTIVADSREERVSRKKQEAKKPQPVVEEVVEYDYDFDPFSDFDAPTSQSSQTDNQSKLPSLDSILAAKPSTVSAVDDDWDWMS